MYIFKNSLKNLIRNKGRNIIIVLIVFFTLASVTLSFSIQKISITAIEQYKNHFGVQANIEFDWKLLSAESPPTEMVNPDGSITMESSYEVPMPTLQEYEKYADSQYVKDILYKASCAYTSDTLTPVADNLHQNEEVVDIGGMTKDELKKFFNVTSDEELENELGGKEELEKVLDTKKNCVGSLVGFTDISMLEEFATGKRKLEQGEFPNARNECIISSDFAKQNDLKVGGYISITGSSKSKDKDELRLKITGIYGDYFNQVTAAEFGYVYGEVFTTYDTLINSGFHYIDMENAVFILTDPDCIDQFEKELHEKGLSKYQKLSYSVDEYIENTKPLKNISHIAEIFTLSVSIIGAIITLLLSLFHIRERKYEIGVLRSMGMGKKVIAQGMIYETLAIVCISFMLSIITGTLLLKPIAHSILGNVSGIQFTLPVSAVIFSSIIAFVLSILSGLCATFFVMRQEPMKILAERN